MITALDYNLYMLVRNKIRDSKDYLSVSELYSKVSSKLDKPMLNAVLKYLLDTNKVIYSKDKKLIWIYADTPKAQKMLNECVCVAY